MSADPGAAGAFRVAVIADAHIHPVEADFGFDRGGTGGLALRPMAETARSLRVFNETGFAFDHALADIAGRGIRDVVLLGDLSDDGQAATMAAIARRLAAARARFGIRFHAIPGNHDIFGIAGRHRTRSFLTGGAGTVLVTSDPRRIGDDPRMVMTPAMYCGGYPEGLSAFAGAGPWPRPADLHWETPFGADPDPARRQSLIRAHDGGASVRIMDASYLVEPVAGLWLLMIDANVFVPHDAADRARHDEDLADAGHAGWPEMLRSRPYILDWIAGVAARASAGGKALAVFSHYPALDAFGPAGAEEQAAIGLSPLIARVPGPAVGAALAAAGVRLHVSGHQHVNAATTGPSGLTDVAVPSLAAFPGAYKILTMRGERVLIETVSVGAMPLPVDVMSAYRAEAAAGARVPAALPDAADYGAFLAAHADHLVARRFLKREWPGDLADMARSAGLGALFGTGRGLDNGDARDLPLLAFVQDYYRLRAGGDLALGGIPPDRRARYAAAAAAMLPPARPDTATGAARFAGLFRAFDLLAARQATADIRL